MAPINVVEDIPAVFREVAFIKAYLRKELLRYLSKDFCGSEVMKLFDEVSSRIERVVHDYFGDVFVAVERGVPMPDYDLLLKAFKVGDNVLVQFTLKGWNYICGATVKEILGNEGVVMLVTVMEDGDIVKVFEL